MACLCSEGKQPSCSEALIMAGLVDFDRNVMSSMPNTRDHKYKLYKTCNTRVRTSFFCERVINIRNKLPNGVNFSSSVKAFKHSIQIIDFTTF